jgi:hypothetical protein
MEILKQKSNSKRLDALWEQNQVQATEALGFKEALLIAEQTAALAIAQRDQSKNSYDLLSKKLIDLEFDNAELKARIVLICNEIEEAKRSRDGFLAQNEILVLECSSLELLRAQLRVID